MNILQKKVDELTSKIKTAAQDYYSDGTSEYTDAQFDQMVDELRELDPDSDVLTVGWGYDVNADKSGRVKFPHIYGVAGSLSKCHNFAEIPASFKAPGQLEASLKLDGLSCVLYYEAGKLVRALTRGDGKIGIDITDKLRVFMAPEFASVQVETNFTGAIRGEILMDNATFAAYQQANPDAKNARNTAAGIIGSLNPSVDDLKKLRLVVYTVVGSTNTFLDGSFITVIRTWLRHNFGGRNVVPSQVFKLDEDTFLNFMQTCRNVWYNEFPADGIVITQRPVVSINHEILYSSVAFKFPAETATTTVQEIEWNLSKTGYVIPRIRVSPVQLSGTTVQYCTGFNAQYIQTTKLCVGAQVDITKSGEIIPYILNVYSEADANLPTICPECGEPLQWDGVHLKCSNPQCANLNRQDLLVWLNNLAPIDGLGDTLKCKFIDRLFGEDVTIEMLMASPDVRVDDSGSHAALIDKMLDKLHTAPVALGDALRALNIPRIGDKTADNLAQHPEIIHDMLRESDLEFYATCMMLGGKFGEANMRSLSANVTKFRRLKLIESRIIWTAAAATGKGKVAITGKLSVPRAVFEKDIKAAGYSVGDMSKDCICLITDDPTSNSSKNLKASAWGIPKVTESEFRKTYLG